MENKYLPLGSIVQLKNGNVKLMIIARFPLVDQDGQVGYYDYGAYIYPDGQVDDQTYFFNKQDIDQVFFEGFVDEQEEKAQKVFAEQVPKISYPHLAVDNQKDQAEEDDKADQASAD